MVELDNKTQLSLFETIRTVLRSNSTISAKFKESDFYDFEPNLKSISSSVPFISISYPEQGTTDLITLNHKLTTKPYDITIKLEMDYEARSKFSGFGNAIIYQLEHSESTFEALGLYDLRVRAQSPGIDIIEGKQMIVCPFVLTFGAVVSR
jgi:hypothetical protein